MELSRRFAAVLGAIFAMMLIAQTAHAGGAGGTMIYNEADGCVFVTGSATIDESNSLVGSAKIFALHGSDGSCKQSWKRPKYSLFAGFSLWKYVDQPAEYGGGYWYECDWGNSASNAKRAVKVLATRTYSEPPCGYGTYRVKASGSYNTKNRSSSGDFISPSVVWSSE